MMAPHQRVLPKPWVLLDLLVVFILKQLAPALLSGKKLPGIFPRAILWTPNWMAPTLEEPRPSTWESVEVGFRWINQRWA